MTRPRNADASTAPPLDAAPPAGAPPASAPSAAVPSAGAPFAAASMTLLVAAVIVHDRERGRVVLVRRGPRARFARGLWDLPSGKSEPGEPVTGTAVRELREETGMAVAPESLRLAGVIHGALGVEAPNGFLTVVFATHEWAGEPVNAEPDKHDRVCWVPTGALPPAFVPTTGRALRDHLEAGRPDVILRGWQARERAAGPERTAPFQDG